MVDWGNEIWQFCVQMRCHCIDLGNPRKSRQQILKGLRVQLPLCCRNWRPRQRVCHNVSYPWDIGWSDPYVLPVYRIRKSCFDNLKILWLVGTLEFHGKKGGKIVCWHPYTPVLWNQLWFHCFITARSSFELCRAMTPDETTPLLWLDLKSEPLMKHLSR